MIKFFKNKYWQLINKITMRFGFAIIPFSDKYTYSATSFGGITTFMCFEKNGVTSKYGPYCLFVNMPNKWLAQKSTEYKQV